LGTPAIALVVACALLVVAVKPVAADDSYRSMVTITEDRLFVLAEDVPIGTLLTEVGRVAGVVVDLDVGLPAGVAARPVSVVFEGIPADDAFRRLLHEYDAVFSYTAERLRRVTVYAPLAAGEPLVEEPRPAVVDGPTVERQSEALWALAAQDDQEARDAALAILAHAPQVRLLEDALDVLDGLESVPAEPLLAFAGGQPSAGLRGRALEVLARHWPRDPRVTALVEAGARDADEGLRDTARALLEILPPD
jgi:hypothetical protein